MRHYEEWHTREAINYAMEGGQALHTHQIIMDRERAPRCFVRAVDRGQNIDHLFDQDVDRLIRTAKRLGVRVVKVERRDTRFQHIDLCGKPMGLALLECVNLTDTPLKDTYLQDKSARDFGVDIERDRPSASSAPSAVNLSSREREG